MHMNKLYPKDGAAHLGFRMPSHFHSQYELSLYGTVHK